MGEFFRVIFKPEGAFDLEDFLSVLKDIFFSKDGGDIGCEQYDDEGYFILSGVGEEKSVKNIILFFNCKIFPSLPEEEKVLGENHPNRCSSYVTS